MHIEDTILINIKSKMSNYFSFFFGSLWPLDAPSNFNVTIADHTHLPPQITFIKHSQFSGLIIFKLMKNKQTIVFANDQNSRLQLFRKILILQSEVQFVNTYLIGIDNNFIPNWKLMEFIINYWHTHYAHLLYILFLQYWSVEGQLLLSKKNSF